jgi:hypothetical protein
LSFEVYVSASFSLEPGARRSAIPSVRLVVKSGSVAYESVYGLAIPPYSTE